MDAKQEKKEIIGLSLATTIALSIFILCDMFFKMVTWSIYNTPIYSLRFAMLLSIILFTTFLAITKKTWRATLICYIIVFLITIINELKVLFSGEPLYFSDIAPQYIFSLLRSSSKRNMFLFSSESESK